MSNSQHAEAMSTSGLREQLAFLGQLKEDGLLHEEALMYVHSPVVPCFCRKDMARSFGTGARFARCTVHTSGCY